MPHIYLFLFITYKLTRYTSWKNILSEKMEDQVEGLILDYDLYGKHPIIITCKLQ